MVSVYIVKCVIMYLYANSSYGNPGRSTGMSLADPDTVIKSGGIW